MARDQALIEAWTCYVCKETPTVDTARGLEEQELHNNLVLVDGHYRYIHYPLVIGPFITLCVFRLLMNSLLEVQHVILITGLVILLIARYIKRKLHLPVLCVAMEFHCKMNMIPQ